MDTLKEYVGEFFRLLKISSDKNKAHFYKDYIESAIMEFLDSEIKKEAYDVYSLFLDIYRVNITGQQSFIDLLDVLLKYEENASVLNDKQRDHYIHSVNVFLLGLSIYSQNTSYRQSFERYIKKICRPSMPFETVHEEFFFRWGLASLFHDIGYPVEIINNMFNKFIALVSGSDTKGNAEAKPFLNYFDFNVINSIESYNKDKFIIPKSIQNALDKGEIRPNCLTELLSFNISQCYSVPLENVKITLNDFLLTMQKYQFVDHGFYSALIVLKWFGELAQKKSRANSLLYCHVLDSATAIYMHNAYRNVFLKKPYSLPPMNPETHPVGYMLILCDECQEWNREAYGVKTKTMVNIDDSDISISDTQCRLHYTTKHGVVNEQFINEKTELLNNLLDVDTLFADGVKITATTLTEHYIADLVERRDSIVPRLLIEHVEMIAKKIHEMYNKNQLQKHPDTPLQHPTWESLPETLKYSNVRQAKDMVQKLKHINCYIAEYSNDDEVTQLKTEEIEHLAKIEHNSWMDERLTNGWTYGPKKDVDAKISPYLVPYESLTEEVKEYDRDAARNIIPFLNSVGIKVYREV